jgi:YHS domain-containing protein
VHDTKACYYCNGDASGDAIEYIIDYASRDRYFCSSLCRQEWEDIEIDTTIQHEHILYNTSIL